MLNTLYLSIIKTMNRNISADSADLAKQRAMFTVGGLILGFSLYKVINRLRPVVKRIDDDT